MDAERLRQIRERAEKATPGPWLWTPRYALSDTNAKVLSDGMVTGIRNEKVRTGRVCEIADNGGRFSDRIDADAAFIAEARQDVPDLVEALLASEELVARHAAELNRRRAEFSVAHERLTELGVPRVVDGTSLTVRQRINLLAGGTE